MFSKTVTSATSSRQVVISANTAAGPFTCRLYVNHGETVTRVAKSAKTLKGAERIAALLLERR